MSGNVREVGFTVLSMSLSLIAVFLPLLMIGGLIGRFFSEFAITLSVAIVISLFISVTLTPVMCAYLLPHPFQCGGQRLHARFYVSGNVLQHHNRIIHHKAGGDGQRHQRQVVEAEAAQVHRGKGADQ